jgi:hypothetical protein
MIDMPPPVPILWVPPQPAIIRPAEAHLASAWFKLAPRAMRRAVLRDMLRSGKISRADAANALVATTTLTPREASLMVTQLVGFGVGGGAFSLAYVGPVASDASDLSTYTFNTQPIGDPSADRLSIFAFSLLASPATTLSSATIGGVSAAITQAAATVITTGLIYARVPTGTTATVVLNCAAGALQASVAPYRLSGHLSDTPSATNSNANGGTDTSLAVTIDVPSEGAAIITAANGGPSAIAWTNANENFDADIGGQIQHSGASTTTPATGLSITANASRIIVAVSWA